MPLVTATPRGQNNGQVITEFIDSVGTTSVTYTYPKTQEWLSVRNVGTKSITVTVGATSQVIQPGQRWENASDFTSFNIVSSSGVQAFEATADEDGSSLPTGGGTGPQGPQGIQGPQGVKGDKGDPGSGGTSTASIFKDLIANFMGDSITAGDSTDRTYHEYLMEMLGLSLCRNYGVSGSSVGGTFDPMYLRVDTMDNDADLIMFFGGTNDWGWTKIPLGVSHTLNGAGDYVVNTNKDTFYGAMHQVCQKLKVKYPDKMIALMTPLHRSISDHPNDLYSDREKDPVTGYLSDYVDAVKDIGRFYSIPVLDLFNNSGLDPFNPTVKQELIPDGLHPNTKGHQKLADVIASFLESTFGKKYKENAVADTTAPSDPTSVVASNITPYWMQLNWTPSADAVGVLGYYVERVPHQGNGAARIAFVKNPTLYVDNLTPGTSYTFSVIAKDASGKTSAPATLVQPTLPSGGVWDNFNRPNNHLAAGVASSGQTWTKYGATADPKSFFGIKDKQLYVHGSAGGSTTDGGGTIGGINDFIGVTGPANFTLEVMMPTMYLGTAFNGGFSAAIVFRATDANNFLFLWLNAGIWSVAKIQAGGLGFTDSLDGAGINGATMKIVGAGSSISVYQNNVLLFPAFTETFNQAGTIFGINSWAPSNRFKDFKLR